jgi:Lon protease-like protein
MVRKRIPLFPLEVVLFPGMALPLHIFEPRYQSMIRRCLDKPQEFGVVLARAKELAAMGCTAEILEVVKTYPDGRMDILTTGRTVIRILKVLSQKPYHEADVEYLEEDVDAAEPEENPELLKLYERCHVLFYGQAPQEPEHENAISLAFQIASDLPFELEHKQAILELRDEGGRREQLLRHLNDLLPILERKYLIREKARGNGHATA